MTLLSRLAGFGLTGLLLSAQSAAAIIYAGVNSGMQLMLDLTTQKANNWVAGGEFTTQNLPGAFGTDYQFINESAIDFFLDAGVNTIRVTFLLVCCCYVYWKMGNIMKSTLTLREGAHVSTGNWTWQQVQRDVLL